MQNIDGVCGYETAAKGSAVARFVSATKALFAAMLRDMDVSRVTCSFQSISLHLLYYSCLFPVHIVLSLCFVLPLTQ